MTAFLALGAIYTIAYGLWFLWLGPIAGQPLVGLIATIVCAMLAIPLWKPIARLVDHLFYGGWYDYRTAVRDILEPLHIYQQPQDLISQVATRVHEVMKYDFVMCLNYEGGAALAGPMSMQDMDSVVGRDMHLGRHVALAQTIEAQRKPVHLHDLLQQIGSTSNLTLLEQQLLGLEQARLWVPLQGYSDVIGLLVVGAKRGEEESNGKDIEILETIGRQFGVLLQNAWIFSNLRQEVEEGRSIRREALAAREEERRRIARELHDEIIQSLVGYMYLISQIRYLDKSDKHRIPERIDVLQETLRDIIYDVRRICTDLRPPVLDEVGLVAAIGSLARSVDSGLTIDLQIEDDPEVEIPDAVSLTTYRIVQESLHNIDRHAQASHATVALSINQHDIRLVVLDDGRGFEMPAELSEFLRRGHLGLVGLRERLMGVNGTLNVKSAPGEGTLIEALIPLSIEDDTN
ncbi:MAG: sensor histidine kinase [Chloroflexi bacterium]|nr:sensor histidine kinase [Chloroflexota bacterium]